MTHAIHAQRRRRLLAAVPALALAAVGMYAPAAATAAAGPTAVISPSEYYINYAEPAIQPDTTGKETKGAGGLFGGAGDKTRAFDKKHASGNPLTSRQLAKLEAKSIKERKSPRKIKQAPTTQVAKLLTMLVEYNPTANDDFTDQMVTSSTDADRTCVPGNIQNGPVHNGIPNPATMSHLDNNSMWVPDFNQDYYNKLLYTSKGITQRVRTDLKGPDGKKGIDLTGLTMRNMYLEMSKGAYTVEGQATPWITLPHSEGWYAATQCYQDADGNWLMPAIQSMNGHKDNPLGPQQMATDAVDALAAAQPNFPWADYDIEDQGDRDGDGNFYEPDGVIDHLVLVHAGEDKSGGGGAQGTYAIWAHSSAVAGGYTIPGTNLKVSNYIVQPEDSGVGVFAHEYGHDLGLPDLYDTSGAGESGIDFWDLMSSGSHSGPIFQSMPTHMGIWDKWVLGWADPQVIAPGAGTSNVKLGQTSRTPVGTQDGIKIDLPPKTITTAVPHSGANMWHTGADQDWADIKISREVAVPNAADAKFWMWNNYVIEADWDYGFVEVSTDGGANWTDLKVYDEAGTLVSTDDGYADPNGNMATFQNRYGLTGDSHGWRHDYVDLSAYAGTTVQVRLRQATDAAFQERGWFADDFSVTGGGSTTWSDDVEAGTAGWTAVGGTWVDTTGPGWRIDSGTSVKAHYYLAEWRNFDGFDNGLQYAYDSTYQRDGAWKVQKIKYNAPGMLLWYRDTTFGSTNHVTANLTALPSVGAKGGLLLVDSHFDPFRRSGVAATKDTSTLKNLQGRPQSSNAAFTLHPTYPFKECLEVPAEPFVEYCTAFKAQKGVGAFTDAKGWAPGLELRDGSLFYRDADASVVIPSAGNAPYTTRIVNPDGTPATDVYGTDLGFTVLGTGNPGDAAVANGVKLTILWATHDNAYAYVQVTAANS
ncbi:M6 family metalloprotease domain-containing protein [Catellatospora vulcania]|uniref:M6 family metalloprotease domain-containing protein n=1 Tax=Catellatospora vulcania TaxID=1460450 RepID=UPI0012D3E780|nr:M6 family metalloprotease domain-containing protein [Catellatospora vulcania]